MFQTRSHADLGKSPTEAYLAEIGSRATRSTTPCEHLDGWPRPEGCRRPAACRPPSPDRPRAARRRAGHRAVELPGAAAARAARRRARRRQRRRPQALEVAPATSAALARLLPAYLDPEAVAVVEGGVEETTALLEQRLDHIFYTGNGTVGRIVMAAAAKHLTPVTLELGGKSPAIVEPDADLEVSRQAHRLGQVPQRRPDLRRARLRARRRRRRRRCSSRSWRRRSGRSTARTRQPARTTAASSTSGTSAGSRRCSTTAGSSSAATTTAASRYIAPTVLAGVDRDAAVMARRSSARSCRSSASPDIDAAIAFMNERDKPLALYVFTESGADRAAADAETSSGGSGFGLPVSPPGRPRLPFGGVGESGMGRYHGAPSFETFSHRKAILDKPLS